ncbi:MAG: threonine--tRNA ligase, partial [Pseudomonadota bacterium]
MDTIKITLHDGSIHSADKGASLQAIAANLKIAPRPVAAVVDGTAVDLTMIIDHDAVISFIEASSKEGLEIYRHSTSHVMAQAVKELYPNIKVAIGPAIEDGFYYDFDNESTFTPEDLVKIESRMQEIISRNSPVHRIVTSKREAIKLFKEKHEDYKVELIDAIEDESVSLYQQGDFIDLCRGPHIASTGMIKAFKLTSIAGAYWRGDEHNKM